jgi:tryptophan halogenase
MDYGWLFRLPVWGRYGNGYIFDSDFINAEQAKLEVENMIGQPIEVGKTFNFDPGTLDQVWIKNCVAVGLSGSFVEPLEASSIGTTIQQTFLLTRYLINYNETSVTTYNKIFLNIMENIRDFIILHYITGKSNTRFWEYINTIKIPDSLATKLQTWRYRLPVETDFQDYTPFKLFGPQNFILVMAGLNLFDRKSINREYQTTNNWLQEETDFLLRKELEIEKAIKLIDHKKFINLIRNYF